MKSHGTSRLPPGEARGASASVCLKRSHLAWTPFPGRWYQEEPAAPLLPSYIAAENINFFFSLNLPHCCISSPATLQLIPTSHFKHSGITRKTRLFPQKLCLKPSSDLIRLLEIFFIFDQAAFCFLRINKNSTPFDSLQWRFSVL